MNNDVLLTQINRNPSNVDDIRSLAFLNERINIIKSWVPYDRGVGLEIAPNWFPLISKEDGDIYYCDRMSHRKLIKREADNPDRIRYKMEVLPIDFIWDGSKLLTKTTPLKFDYIVSSHVLEHVPNFLGFLYQQREALEDNGVIAFVLPDFKRLNEHFRPSSTAAQLIDAYMRNLTSPTPGQVYESCRHALDVDMHTVDYSGKKYTDFKRAYTNEETINFARLATYQYLDVHCWAFDVESFQNVALELSEVGMFDFDIIDIKSGETAREFYVKLKPNKPPRPPIPNKIIRFYERVKKRIL